MKTDCDKTLRAQRYNKAAPLPGLVLQPKAGPGRAGPLLHILDVHNEKKKKKIGKETLTLHFTLQSSLACYNTDHTAGSSW